VEKLKTIKDLLSGVIGVSAERGDQVLVETLPFDATLNAEPPPSPPATSPLLPPSKFPPWAAPYVTDPKMLMIGAGAIAGAVLILTTLMFMMFRRKKPAKGSVQTPAALASRGGSEATIEGADSVQHQIQDKLAAQQALQAQAEATALSNLKLPTVSSKKSEVLVKHLRESVTKDTPGSANILRSWLTESGNE
jgi:flagellar M-ring protein FliF